MCIPDKPVTKCLLIYTLYSNPLLKLIIKWYLRHNSKMQEYKNLEKD